MNTTPKTSIVSGQLKSTAKTQVDLVHSLPDSSTRCLLREELAHAKVEPRQEYAVCVPYVPVQVNGPADSSDCNDFKALCNSKIGFKTNNKLLTTTEPWKRIHHQRELLLRDQQGNKLWGIQDAQGTGPLSEIRRGGI